MPSEEAIGQRCSRRSSAPRSATRTAPCASRSAPAARSRTSRSTSSPSRASRQTISVCTAPLLDDEGALPGRRGDLPGPVPVKELRRRSAAVHLPGHHLQELPDAADLRDPAQHRPVRRHGAHPGAQRHRQGAVRLGDPQPQPAVDRPSGQGQLRRAARDPAGVRALRLRQGRLHRRQAEPRRAGSRPPRAGPSSSTRSATCRCRCRSSCCACSAPRVRAARLGAHHQGRRAGGGRHQQGPGPRWWPRAGSARTSTTGST